MGLISRVSSRTYRKRTKNNTETNMAVGKNKRLTKGSKKGGKKKVVDPFTKKDWYSIKAPAVFKVRNVGHTLVTRTTDNYHLRVFVVAFTKKQSRARSKRPPTPRANR